MGSLGVSDYQGIVSPAYYVFSPNFEFFSNYLHHLLRSKVYIDLYASVSKGIRPGQWDLSLDEFNKIKILIPPLDEQKKISKFLNLRLDQIDRITRLEKLQVEKLKEYRQSLISNLVKGKTDIYRKIIQ